MIRAIDDYKIVGIETTLPFCKFVMQHEAFTSGNFDTHFVNKYFKPEVLNIQNANYDEIAAIISAVVFDAGASKISIVNSENSSVNSSNWKKNRL
jgi:pyruvate carboxylase